MREKLIPVRPRNLRSIALYAIDSAAAPIVFMNDEVIEDHSEEGPLTQKGISSCRNFEIRDGRTPILGFHDHPDQMWIAESRRAVAEHCAIENWLKIEGPSS
jgi:hypothetical protein